MFTDNNKMMLSFPFKSVNLNFMKNVYLTAQKSVNHWGWQVTTAMSLFIRTRTFSS